MKVTMVECVMGILGFGEDNELVDKYLFPEDPKIIAEKLEKIETGKVVDEIFVLIRQLQEKGYTIFTFESPELARNVRKKLNVQVDVKMPSDAGDLLRRNLDKIAVKIGFVSQETEIRAWLHKVSMELSRIRVRKAVERRDLVVVQAIQTIDDLDKTSNLLTSRIREWYGLHFPELGRFIEKNETYARLVAKLGGRKKLTAENLEKEDIPEFKARQIVEAAQTSMGAQLDKEDINQIQALCVNVLNIYRMRQSLDDYLDSIMDEVAPNVRTLVGSLLGARLIALAGGLENLAKMPASTIQVLGAEKALFRALRTGTRPPKHGIIFQHTLLHQAERWQRGKVARALAGKLAIAARTDAFSGKCLGSELKLSLERRFKEIQEKYEAPPSPIRSHRRKKLDRRS